MGTAHHHCRGTARPRVCDMDVYVKDPTVTRAMALALMRQALALLDAVGETGPAAHLQMAVDTMSRASSSPLNGGSGAGGNSDCHRAGKP
jgi:hypothetical protein